MRNIFTKGTRGLKVLGDPKSSLDYVPSNEDWAFVVDVISITLLSHSSTSKSVLVEGTKIWDKATIKQSFYAMATNNYKFEIGAQAIFYRVGDGDNTPSLVDFQLHDLANTDKVSFLAIPYAQLVFVEDIGSGQGRTVDFDSSGTKFIPTNSVTGNLTTVEPLANFHNNTPPFKENRIYPAQMIGDIFLVYLAGFGDVDNETQITIDAVTTTWQYDNSGKLISFSKPIVFVVDTNFYIQARSLGQSYQGETLDLGGGSYASGRKIETFPNQESCAPPTPSVIVFAITASEKWTIRAYDNFNSSTQEFSNEYHSWDTTLVSDSLTGTFFQNSTSVYQPKAGTGIPNKLSYYPAGANPYEDGPEKFLQVEETGVLISGTATAGAVNYLEDDNKDFLYLAVEVGHEIRMQNPARTEVITSVSVPPGQPDGRYARINFASGVAITGSTTYEIGPINRKTVLDPKCEEVCEDVEVEEGVFEEVCYDEAIYRAPAWQRWDFSFRIWPTYDPATETVSSSISDAPYAAADGGYPNLGAYSGLNDEATFLIYERNGSQLSSPPGWPEVQVSSYSTEAIFVDDRDKEGGRLQISRDRADWYWWNGTSFQNPHPLSSAGQIYIAERWNGFFRSTISGIFIVGETGIYFIN